MNTELTMIAIFAIVAAFGLLGAVAVEDYFTLQKVDARGCTGIGALFAFNASKGRCFNP